MLCVCWLAGAEGGVGGAESDGGVSCGYTGHFQRCAFFSMEHVDW
jgi:hypothetical protein